MPLIYGDKQINRPSNLTYNSDALIVTVYKYCTQQPDLEGWVEIGETYQEKWKVIAVYSVGNSWCHQ